MSIFISLLLTNTLARAARLDTPLRDHLVKECSKNLGAIEDDWIKIKIRRDEKPPTESQPNLFILSKIVEKDKQVILLIYRGDMEQMMKSGANSGDGGLNLNDNNIERHEFTPEEFEQFKKDNPKVGHAQIKFLTKDNVLTGFWGPNSLLTGDVIKAGKKFYLIVRTQHHSEISPEDKESVDVNFYTALVFDKKPEVGAESAITQELKYQEAMEPEAKSTLPRLVGFAGLEGTFKLEPGKETAFASRVTEFNERKSDKKKLLWIVLGNVSAKK